MKIIRSLIVVFTLCALFSPRAFTADSIVLRLMAVNPSKEQPQRTTVKTYLPKEIKPDDIIDKGDLELTYDTQQGSYFVSGDYELKPGEAVEKTIEIKNIWVIPLSEIESVRQEAAKTADLMKKTEFADRASYLQNVIDLKIEQILEVQKEAVSNPEQYISKYRNTLRILESIKSDLALARSLLAQAKTLPITSVWRTIIAVIVFLGVLGISFFLVWQRQVKVIMDDTFFIPKADENAPDVQPEAHPANKEGKDKP